MKKYLFAVIFIFSSLAIFFSCEDDDLKNDKDTPTISDVKVNWNDTIIYNGDTLLVNDSVLHKFTNNPDTVITGRKLNFSARFRDDKGLSSYMIKLFSRDDLSSETSFEDDELLNCSKLSYDYPVGGQQDTVLCMINSWASIFGKRDTIITQNELIIADSIPKAIDNVYKNLPTHEGVYNFNVYCLDKSGKESYFNHKIYIISREKYLNNRFP